MSKVKAFCCWSGGKESALSLLKFAVGKSVIKDGHWFLRGKEGRTANRKF